MRRRTYFNLNPSELHLDQGKDGFYLKSKKTLPYNKPLDSFEENLFNSISKIKFRKQNNNLLSNIRRDIEDIKKSEKIWVRADKSKNI